MNKYIAILLLVFSGSAFADSYLCIGEEAGGVRKDMQSRKYKGLVLNAKDSKWVVTNEEDAGALMEGHWVVKVFSDGGLYFYNCENDLYSSEDDPFSMSCSSVRRGSFELYFKKSGDGAYEAGEYIAIINKPAGIPVSGNRYRTVQNALPFNVKPSKERDALKLPRPVHRLDTPTSGLLIVAKTATALMNLGHQLQNRKIAKQYRAIVSGKTPESGQIENPINGQLAITSYKTVRHIRSVKTNWLSLVDLFPVTGRTHQLRVHMANEGHPIVGDKLYVKNQPLLKGKGLFLCAIALEFIHPVLDTKMTFKIEQPAKFTALLNRESERWKKYH